MVARFLFLTLAAALAIKYSNFWFEQFFLALISRNIFVLLTYFFVGQAKTATVWLVLIHQLYLPDIAVSAFHSFRSLQNSLNGKNLNSLEDYKTHLE